MPQMRTKAHDEHNRSQLRHIERSSNPWIRRTVTAVDALFSQRLGWAEICRLHLPRVCRGVLAVGTHDLSCAVWLRSGTSGPHRMF